MKTCRLFLILFLTAVCLYSQTDSLTIMYVNDSHSTLSPLGPRDNDLQGKISGIARIASIIGSEQMSGGNVMAFHCGDFMIGDLFFNKFFGVPELQILSSIGLDAMGVGNHEFDLGPENLYQVFSIAFSEPAAGFPFISSNSIMTDYPPLKDYIKPYIVKQEGNIKIGIFGLTTPETNLLSSPAPVVIDTGYVQTAAMYVDSLKNQGCKVIICLSHLGAYYDTQLAGSVSGINLILGAHDHLLFPEPVVIPNGNHTTYIVQAGAFYKTVGRIRFKLEGSTVTYLDNLIIPVDENIPEEPLIKGTVEVLIDSIEATYGPVYRQQIATASTYFVEVAENLTVDGNHDTPVGNFVADAFRSATGTQIAMEPGGSTAQPIYCGKIVAADLFRVVGYGMNVINGLGFQLAKFRIRGDSLIMGLEIGVAGVELNDEYLPQVSGMTYKYDPQRPAFERVFNVKINNQDINPTEYYTVTSNELLVMMLTTLGVSISNIEIMEGLTEFQVISGYAAGLGTLIPYTDGRVSADRYPSGINEENGMITDFKLDQNYPNPFNPTTTIGYNLSIPGMVKLTIYNLAGEKITELVNEYKEAGHHSIKWDAGNLTSGVYLYKLEAGGFTLAKKLILLK